MRERKYVKFRVDMFDDTKLKIINKRLERDLIDYVWLRLGLLAGKVNREGDLFMSRNIPYTVETLAIEFDREVEQIKLALDIFIELEMLELTDGRVYRVKNFAKHQNIKIKEKIKSEDKENDTKNIEVAMKEASKNEICENGEKKSDRKPGENKVADIRNDDKRDLEIAKSEINKDNNMINETKNSSSKDNVTPPPQSKKIKKTTRKKKKDKIDITDEDVTEDNVIGWFTDGELLVGEGERVIMSMDF